MLESKNDNLQHADGVEESQAVEGETKIVVTNENQGEEIVLLSEEQNSNNAPEIELHSDIVMNSIQDENAAESEDETLKARYDVPMEDYEKLSMEELFFPLLNDCIYLKMLFLLLRRDL